MKIEHRGKTFEYTEEASQDMKSQWGVDAEVLANAAIDSFVENKIDFSSVSIQITRSDDEIAIRVLPNLS